MIKPTIIDYHTTRFGEIWDKSLSELVSQTVFEILKSSQLEIEQIGAIFIANMLSGVLENNLHLTSKVAEILEVNIPIFRVESACASGGMAIHLADSYLRSGATKTALVIGAEKMTDYCSEKTTSALMSAASGEEYQAGLTFAGVYAMIARLYLDTFGYTEENLAHIAVKNHYHGSLNHKAHFRNQIDVSKVMHSPKIADPLKLLDCSPISDGASSLIITTDPYLIQKSSKKATILTSQIATDSISLKNRENFLELKSTKKASKKAYQKADLLPSDIDIAEVHDCFTIAEALAIEDLGFCEKGQAGKKVVEQPFDLNHNLNQDLNRHPSQNSRPVVNISGGLKASGHPVGATGVKQVGEIFLQLNDAGEQRQVKNANYGLAHNVGGSGGTAVVNILARV
jgi:acetyl-CoA C-acetyltransferase